MESNKVADEVRMKLLGKVWCGHCQMEVKPSIVLVEGQPTCPNCYGLTEDTKPKEEGTIHPHKETK